MDETLYPVGCLECGDVHYPEYPLCHCPSCGSVNINTIEDILDIAMEHQRFMGDLGLLEED